MHEIYIDYLQCSIMFSEQYCRDNAHKEVPPQKFYKRGYEDSIGVRRYFGNPNSKKCLMVYSGRPLHNRRAVGYSDVELVNEILSKDGKITRIDWAVTDYISENFVSPSDISNMCSANEVSGTLTKYGWKQIAGANVGEPLGIETCYIGSPKKRGTHGIFRAYDTGLEQGLMRDIMTRLELEERGDNAHMSARRFAMHENIAAIMNTRLVWKNNTMMRFFDEPPIDMSRGAAIIQSDDRENNDKRWIWLQKQVAPALRQAILDDIKFGNGNERMLQFLESVGIIASNDK